jgi:alpha-L-fucosidase
MEYNAFVHFSLNTYTNKAWGYGDEDINLFNPQKLDCRQWARICKQAGMKGIIITAKHHSGFCLWPSQYTEYSVKNAPWKNGKGDVVKEMAEACKEYGLKLGIYLSPWDRNRPDYGKPEYITYFRNQLTELLTNYGPIFEVWFDGANGGNGYYGGANETRTIDRTTYYDWPNTYKLVRQQQPNIVIWNDGGDRADLRWVGTEDGYVGETNWSLLHATGDVPWHMLHYGVEDGNAWVPAEVNTSIRPEWFYHPDEDDKVKTVPRLMETYYRSIGSNATLLLNFPIMPNGLIHPTDEKAVLDFANAVKKSFANNLASHKMASASNVRGNSKQFGAAMALDANNITYWATDDEVTSATITIDLGKPTQFNRFLVQEYIPLGQRVKAFNIEALVNGTWQRLASHTTIGYKRILRFPSVRASKLRLNITDAKACPTISNIGIYNAPLFLSTPVITRNQTGLVTISSNDVGPNFYYTLNGSQPSAKAIPYTGPFMADGKLEIKAIAYDPATAKYGPVGAEIFGISKKQWTIVGATDVKANAIFDGNPESAWQIEGQKDKPAELVIDLGDYYTLAGFKYLPDANRWSAGTISHFKFYTSPDGVLWTLAHEGEFSNIKNNPVWQTKTFAPVNARFIKLQALKNAEGTNDARYAEIDIITE